MASGNGFTPTQRRILAVLDDGLPHGKVELMTCLNDELAEWLTVMKHVSDLRKKLRPKGQDILCQNMPDGPRYRIVRLLASADE